MRLLHRTKAAFQAFRSPTTPVTGLDSVEQDDRYSRLDSLNFRNYDYLADRDFDDFIASTALTRCFELVSSTCARIFVSTVYVTDPNGNRYDNNVQRQKIMMLRESWDGGFTSAFVDAQAAFRDIMLGNTMLVPMYRRDLVVGLTRMVPTVTGWTNQTTRTYYLRRADDRFSQERQYNREDVIHARWSAARNGSLYSVSPLLSLITTVKSQSTIEKWVLKHFKEDARDRTVFLFPGGGMGGGLGQDKDAIASNISKFRKGTPFVGDSETRVITVEDRPADKNIVDLEKFLVRNIARVFGVPVPMIGEEMSAWGSGVEALNRAFWKQTLAPTLNKFLEPLSQRILDPGYNFAIDPMEFIRGDMTEMSKILTATAPQGAPAILTDDERRRMIGYSDCTPEQRAELDKRNAQVLKSSEAARAGREATERDQADERAREDLENRNVFDLTAMRGR